MAGAKSIPQVVAEIKRGMGSGKIFTAKQVGPYLDKELREVAEAVKEFMMELLDADRQHKIRRDQSGFYENAKVTMTVDGGKITLPDYAQSLDEGRAPGAKLVPLGDLIRWIKRYRIVGRTRKTGQFRKASQDSVNDAAVAIQRAIYKNGIKARPFIEATLDYQQVLIAAIVDEILIPQIVSIVELTLTTAKK